MHGEDALQPCHLQDLLYRRARGGQFQIAALLAGPPVRGEQRVLASTRVVELRGVTTGELLSGAGQQMQLGAGQKQPAIAAVPAIPRTLTAKKLELPVKRILQGGDPRQVMDAGAVDNPDALRWFAAYQTRTSLP